MGVAVAVPLAIFALVRTLEGFFDADAVYEARFLDGMDMEYVDVAIAASASLSLFLELAVTRWQSSVLEFLAFYKNFSRLACFAGLGLPYPSEPHGLGCSRKRGGRRSSNPNCFVA